MRKYTSDPCILKIMDSFFDERIVYEVGEDETRFNSLFKRIVHECVTQDKLYVLSFWISVIKVNLSNCSSFSSYKNSVIGRQVVRFDEI